MQSKKGERGDIISILSVARFLFFALFIFGLLGAYGYLPDINPFNDGAESDVNPYINDPYPLNPGVKFVLDEIEDTYKIIRWIGEKIL